MRETILILVCGASGSGKTTVSNYIKKELPADISSTIVCLDNFYNIGSKIPKLNYKLNFDHPDSFDWNLVKKTIKNLLNKKNVNLSEYDYKKHKFFKTKNITKPVDVIIFEGLYTLYNNELNSLSTLKIFVDTESDECLMRRIIRDVNERSRTIDSVIEQWREVVKPMFNAYIEPQKRNADIIIPWKNTNHKPIKLVTDSIRALLK